MGLHGEEQGTHGPFAFRYCGVGGVYGGMGGSGSRAASMSHSAMLGCGLSGWSAECKLQAGYASSPLLSHTASMQPTPMVEAPM